MTDYAISSVCTCSFILQAQDIYKTFVNTENITLNIDFVNEETINKLMQWVKELEIAEKKVDESKIEIAIKIKELCCTWITVCEELIKVRFLIFYSKFYVTDHLEFSE